jgi:hypothetical protein
MNDRTVYKQRARVLGEMAVRSLVRLPRKTRRAAGRAYGAAAWRLYKGLEASPYKGGTLHANPAVTAWIVKELHTVKEKLESNAPEA